MDGRLDATEDGLEARPPLALRHRPEVLVAEREQVPGDERRGRLGGEHLDPRRGGMDPQQQRFEVEPVVAGDDDLAVEDAPIGQGRAERIGQLREVAIERLEVARLRVDLVAVAEDERPEAVPLGLEQPAVVGRQPVGRLGEHGFERGVEGECHDPNDTAVGRGRPPTAASPGRPGPPRARGSTPPGSVNAGSVPSSRRRSSRSRRSGRRSASGRAGRAVDEDRDRVIGEDAEVRRVEAGVAAGRDEARVDDALHVPCRHETRRRDEVERDQRDETDDRQTVPHPAHPPGQRQDRHDGQRHREGRDRHQDVQAELRPAVGILVEAEPERGGHEHDRGQPDERKERREIRPGPSLDGRLEGDDDPARQAGRRDELEEASPRVVAVGHAGRHERALATEQVGDLEHDEQADDQVHDRQDDDRLHRPEPGRVDRQRRPGGRTQRRALERRDARRRDHQEARRQPRAREREHRATSERAEIELPAQQVVQPAPEDRVGRGEEHREDERQRQADEQAADERQPPASREPGCPAGRRDRPGPGRGRHAWSARHDGPERPRRHAGDGRGGPARDGQPRHRRHGGAEEGQRAERVQHRQERVAADGDEPREDQRRDRQPGVERIRSPSLTAHQPGREQRHRNEQHDVDAERGAVEDDFGEEPEAEGGREETSSDGSVQWAVLRCGRRGQARVGGQGSGRLGRTSCGDDRGQGRRTAPPCRTGRGTMAG